MKIYSSKERLLAAITVIQKATSVKSVSPILEGVYIEAYECIRLVGNDLDLAIEYRLDGTIADKGAVVVNARLFSDIIKRMPDAEIFIHANKENDVLIECQDTCFRVKGLPPAGYPKIPEVDTERHLEVDQKTLKDMIKQTVFAASTDESLPLLTGVLMEYKDQRLTLVAADRSARMAIRKSQVESEESECKVILPSKILNEIAKILQPEYTPITLHMSSKYVLFEMDRCKVLAKLLEGEYYNYASIVKRDYETKIVVSAGRLLLSMERALLISFGDKKHPVVLHVNDEKVVVSCNTEYGEITDEMPADMDGSPMKIGFNPQLLLEALRTIEDERVEILFATSLGPATIKSINSDKFLYIIGALRL